MATTPPRDDAYRMPTGPYPGLRPFLNHESELLMGRERQVAQVVERLVRKQFVAVVGGSGSGKSSLIRAGVVPKLWGGGIPEAGRYWVPVICTPGTAPGGADDVVRTADATAGGPAELSETTLPVTAAAPADPVPGSASTPISRLAWKLSRVLQPAATEAQAQARRQEIAAVLRQPGGFSRLVELYSDDLPARGPSTQEARFLFVIDQFEEVFDPSNKPPEDPARRQAEAVGAATGDAVGQRWFDAERLVEAVIDHYFDPHPRCHVVLTMRSERLADCAGYLELPEAINTSMYLVRRLGEREVRDAIVGPAKYYLRLLRRDEEDDPHSNLPDDVSFDEAVIARLQADVEAIKDDPDHLPLLQHVLARTWEAACRAEGIGCSRVPRHLGWAHFEEAVAPPHWAEPAPGAPGWLRGQPQLNTLRSSLERWAQLTYERRSAIERPLIDTVLRHLAYKDPNNGLYFQQRIGVNDRHLLAGVDDPRPVLKPLLSQGFLDSVNYLFWDTEDPQHVTLKVSHEAYIRGWCHFRNLIDREAERFEEFVSLLKRCANWQDHGRDDRLLLADTELLRLNASALEPVFSHPHEGDSWFKVLVLNGDGRRLAAQRGAAAQFIARSHEAMAAAAAFDRQQVEARNAAEEVARLARHRQESAEADRTLAQAEAARAHSETARAHAEAARANAETARAQAREAAAKSAEELAMLLAAQARRRARRRYWLMGGGALAMAAGLAALGLSQGVLYPIAQEIGAYVGAQKLAENRTRSDSNPQALPEELKTLLAAAAEVAKVERGNFLPPMLPKDWALKLREAFVGLPPVQKFADLASRSVSEPFIQRELRHLLATRTWPSLDTGGATPPAADPAFRHSQFTCDNKGLPNVYGVRLHRPAPWRDIVVRTRNAAVADIEFFESDLSEGDSCNTLLTQFWSAPGKLHPTLLLTADGSRIAMATEGQGSRPSVAFYAIGWVTRGDKRLSAQVSETLSVAPGDAYVRLVGRLGDAKESDLKKRIRVLDMAPLPGGSAVATAGHRYRTFADGAVALAANPAPPASGPGWQPLQPAPAGGACDQYSAQLSAQLRAPGAPREALQQGSLCVDVQREQGGGGPPPGAGASPPCAADAQGGCYDRVTVRLFQLASPGHGEAPVAGRPASAEGQAPPPSARNTPRLLGTVGLGWLPSSANQWSVGTAGAGTYDGWIAVRRGAAAPAGDGGGATPTADNPTTWVAPWSTAALVRLGEAVLPPACTFFGTVNGGRPPAGC